jgi:3-deoxy-D-manno-octulosonate 8-phosphate phosphatase KdsC-like HAD superfamily phosphatase
MKGFLVSEGGTMDEVAYIGDELNDIKLLKACGLSFAVGDANYRVKAAADVICENFGGHGAVREATEKLLDLKGLDIDYIISEHL